MLLLPRRGVVHNQQLLLQSWQPGADVPMQRRARAAATGPSAAHSAAAVAVALAAAAASIASHGSTIRALASDLCR